jgi:hypothetical protein
MAQKGETGMTEINAEQGREAAQTTDRNGPDGGPDPEAMSLQGLEDAICVQAAVSTAQMCRWLEMIAEFDRREGWVVAGLPSCADWLSYRCSVSPATAREHVRVARAVVQLPQTRSLFAAGELSYSKVRALTRVVTPASEPEFVPIARTATAAQLERIVRGYRAASGTGLGRQAKRSMAWRNDDDGMWCLRLRVTPEEGATIVAAMCAAAAASETDPAEGSATEGAGADSHSPPSQESRDEGVNFRRRESVDADALVMVCEGFLACAERVDASGDDTTTVVVHVDADQLADQRADQPSPPRDAVAPPSMGSSAANDSMAAPTHIGPRCSLEGGPGLEPETARRLACDSAIVAMLHDRADDVLHVGRKTRRISPALRRALRARDGGCRYPGCRRRRNLNAHHIRHWADGGPTDLANLVLLCRRHHMLLHEAGYALAGAPSGPLTWLRPDGRPLPDQLPSGDRNAVRAAIEAADREAGLPYNRYTLLPGWAGERFDLREIVWVLLQPSVRRQQEARSQRGAQTGLAAGGLPVAAAA